MKKRGPRKKRGWGGRKRSNKFTTSSTGKPPTPAPVRTYIDPSRVDQRTQ